MGHYQLIWSGKSRVWSSHSSFLTLSDPLLIPSINHYLEEEKFKNCDAVKLSGSFSTHSLPNSLKRILALRGEEGKGSPIMEKRTSWIGLLTFCLCFLLKGLLYVLKLMFPSAITSVKALPDRTEIRKTRILNIMQEGLSSICVALHYAGFTQLLWVHSNIRICTNSLTYTFFFAPDIISGIIPVYEQKT